MMDLSKLSDSELIERYTDLIQASQGISRLLAEHLAKQLIDTLFSHGGSPRVSEEEAKRNIEVIVGKWLESDKYKDGTWLCPRKSSKTETEIYSLINRFVREKRERLSKATINQVLYPDTVDSPEAAAVLATLQAESFLERAPADSNQFIIKSLPGIKVGPEQLLKGHILRYFGARPSLLSKRDVRNILRNRLETYDLSEPKVQAALAQLEKDGVVKIIGTDERFLEVLKLPV